MNFEEIDTAITEAVTNYEVDFLVAHTGKVLEAEYLDATGKVLQEKICAVTITPEQKTEIINGCNAANKHLRWIDWVLVEGVNGSAEIPVMLICCKTTGSVYAYVLHKDGCFVDGELQ